MIILIFQRPAVQADKAVLFAEYRSKLVHDATVYATVIVLCSLSDLRQFELVYFVFAKQIIQCISIGALQCCRRRHACSQRNVSGESRIESFYVYTPFDHFAAYAENVPCPTGPWSIFFFQAKLNIIFQVDGISLYYICPIGFDFGNHSLVNGTGKDKATIIIRMFTDEVDSSRSGIYSSCSPIKMFDETTSYVFYIHIIYVLKMTKLNQQECPC